MDLFRSIRGKVKKRKDNRQPASNASSTPTLAGGVQATTQIAASHGVGLDSPSNQPLDVGSDRTPTVDPAPKADQPSRAVSESERAARRDRWLARVALALNVTKVIADGAGIGPLKAACEGTVMFLESVQAVKDNQSAWSELVRTLQEHTTALQRQLDQVGINDVVEQLQGSISGPVTIYINALKELLADVCMDSGLDESKLDQGLTLSVLAKRIGATKLEANAIAAYTQHLTVAKSDLMTSLMLYVTIAVSDSADAEVLSKLPCKEYRRPKECLTGTREDILAMCKAWSMDPDAPNILWIKGAPGAGKSAIASSLVPTLRIKRDRLGSNFFFKSQESAITTTAALWQNTAYDLARHPTIRKHLSEKLRKKEIDFTTPNITELFHQLIGVPLTKIANLPIEQSPVIIIDALDECGGLEGARSEERRELMITLVLWSKLSPNAKLIVLSREESDISKTFLQIKPQTIDLLTQESTAGQSKRDLQTFLAHELREIAVRYTTLPVDWPGPQVTETLALKANGLFIWASTVVRYISAGNAVECLKEVIHGEGEANLASLYGRILDTAFPNAKDELLQRVRAVLAAVIVAKRVLDLGTLAELLMIEPPTVEHICNGLRSVLEIQGGLSFRHQSFVDFLLNSSTTYPALHITSSDGHQILANRCLCVMKERLCFNICEISSSYLLNNQVPSSSIATHIPPHLRYASLHWVDHLHSTTTTGEIGDLVRHILEVQFLFWLEVAGLCGFVDEVQRILFTLIAWLRANGCDDLIPMVTDMRRFTSHFDYVISSSVPHIYLSALPLSPPSSEVKKQYQSQYPNTVAIKAGGYRRWSPNLLTVRGHRDHVNAVAFSPDGHYVVSGSDDGTVRLWDAENGQQIGSSLEGHTYWVRSVAFSPDGLRIVSGSDDKTVRLWDAETGQQIGTSFKGHTSAVYSVAFSSDSRRIVSGSYDQTVRLWDVETGQQIGPSFEGHTECVWSVAFSPDGRRIVSGSNDKTVRLWDAETGQQIGSSLTGHTDFINSVAFSPDGRRIVSGSSDQTVRLWDAETGQQVGTSLEGHADSVHSVAFSPDGRRLISGSGDQTVRLWDLETGQQIGPSLTSHTSTVRSVAFSSDGRRIVSGSDDQTVRLWDAENDGQIGLSLEGHSDWVRSVAFSPDGCRIVSGSDDQTVRLWDAGTGRQIGPSLKGHTGFVYSVALSSDSRHIVSGSDDKTVRLWDTETGMQVRPPFEGHTESVYTVAISPNGRRIVSGSRDRTVRLWDAGTGQQIEPSLKGHNSLIMSVAFSPDGRRIVSGSYDQTVRMWDAETGQQIKMSLLGHEGSVFSVEFSPDSRRIVSGSHDRTMRLWDAETGQQIGTSLDGHMEGVNSVSFSPDGSHIASSSDDRTVRLWDAGTNQQAGPSLEGHMGIIYSVNFSPDGHRIVSSSEDQTIRLWDVTDALDGHFGDDVPSLHSRIDDDGWLLGPNHARLLWVPVPFRTGFERPGVHIIGGCERLSLDTSKFAHGEEWTRVRGATVAI